MTALYEYYNTGDDMYAGIYANSWRAQTFTPVTAHKIISVKLLLYRYGLPGIITVGIRATDVNGHPTGADLCSGTTDGDTLPTAAPYEWREITLGVGYDLTAGIKYAIVVRVLSGTVTKFLRWREDITSPTYAGGCYEYSFNSGSIWTADANADFMFEDWGEPSVVIYPKTVSMGYIIEARDISGNLLAILENAHEINFVEQLNRPSMLDFNFPTDDSKISYISPDNEIWLRDYETGMLIKKFRISRRGDERQ